MSDEHFECVRKDLQALANKPSAPELPPALFTETVTDSGNSAGKRLSLAELARKQYGGKA
ncbi:MAG TPA: hypothetical protein EYP90_05975 [Chromatiaceae bacterium]|nr:hypothetical protein [Chromatiaceae bacterium]